MSLSHVSTEARKRQTCKDRSYLPLLPAEVKCIVGYLAATPPAAISSHGRCEMGGAYVTVLCTRGQEPVGATEAPDVCISQPSWQDGDRLLENGNHPMKHSSTWRSDTAGARVGYGAFSRRR